MAERTMPERPACDQDVRERVTGDLRTTFLLEAGAGTGKTRVLVDRYVRCVLDPELGAGDVRQVAAITFTEKAAGELRQRVREEFEALAAGASPGSTQAEAIARARDALDDAPISTIHGFAGRLLREFPVEAGVDPAFEQLDALAGDLERARLWDDWLAALAAGDLPEPRVRDWLSRLLRAGVRLADVRELAVGAKGVFGERYDLDAAPAPPAEPDLAAGLHALREPTAQLFGFCGAACSDEEDKACCAATDLVDACERLLAEPPAGLDALAAALLALPVKATAGALGGRQGNWDAAQGGKDELWLRYQRLAAAIAALCESHAAFVTGLAVAVADAFARWAGEVQLALGQLDFTDLLGRLRDLLARDLTARGALQRRFRYLLVDEFQDTDPLQAEIVFYLCEREPVAADWRRVVLQPGKLFVVGDPKQSIYRFRRADIGMYDEVKELMNGQPGGAGAVEAISQNFRTTPALVDWVNRVFTDVFDGDAEPGRQPRYQRVAAYRPAAEGPRVAVLLGAAEYGGRGAGGAEAARRDEAAALAALLVAVHGADAAQWHVQDRDARQAGPAAAVAGEAAAPPRRRPRDPPSPRGPRAGRTSPSSCAPRPAWRRTSRPCAPPACRIAWTAARPTSRGARSPTPCSACAPSTIPATAPPCTVPCTRRSSASATTTSSCSGTRADASTCSPRSSPRATRPSPRPWRRFARLHERRVASEPHELAAELLRVTHAVEFAAATGAGGPQAIANLEKLVERARAFAGAGGGGLAAFLGWAAEAGDAAGEQESQLDDEADVVHLLTIHKAKGLEYPIVVLVGGALAGGWGGRETVRPIVDRARRRLAVKLKAELPGAAARDLTTSAYSDLHEREKEMEASELRRLLYVAATRARDRLVVTSFGKLTKQGGEAASGVLLGCAAGALPAPARIETAYEDDGLLVLPPGEPPARDERDEALDAATLVAARSAWLGERAALLATATRPAAATSPSGLEHVDEEVRAGGPGAPPGRARALALGSAVHRVMELCDLDDASSLPALAAAVTLELGRPDLAESAAALAAACWRAAPVRAAARSADAHRELSIGALVDGAVVTGAIDLLYRDGEQWVVVDYKTDRGADPRVLRERYTPQGAAYALAVEAATGDTVREVAFVAAAAGVDGAPLVISVPVDDQLRGLARTEVEAAVVGARAIRPDELGADG